MQPCTVDCVHMCAGAVCVGGGGWGVQSNTADPELHAPPEIHGLSTPPHKQLTLHVPPSVHPPGGEKALVGLVHNWFPFEPKQSCCTPFYVTWMCNKLNYLWGSTITLRYLQTGIFEWKPSW